VVAWAWYVDGVRQDCDDLQFASDRAKAGDGFVWLGLRDPTDDDMAGFAHQFDLHTLAIEDAVEGHTRSKLDVFGETLFAVISTVSYVEHDHLTESSEVVDTGQIMVFVGQNFVMTVRRGQNTSLKTLRATLEADPRRLARGSYYVLYRILDTVVDDYVQVVADIEEDVDDTEEDVFDRNGSGDIDRVYQLKRELIEFRRSISPLALPLQALATRDLPVVPVAGRAYFREVADHLTEARESIASFDDVLTTLLQAALARASVADNQDMRKISAAVALFAIPTTIGAIYGMNFDNMPELHTRYGYFVVLAVMITSMIAAFAFFRHNKWI
jgi:magnesium transporter